MALCRSSIVAAVLLLLCWQDGKFRWNRFDNLLREGSKSQDFDAGQLWLLAGWILSPNAAAVRATLATELAKMLDAAAAADVRQRLARRCGCQAHISLWLGPQLHKPTGSFCAQ